MKQAGRLRAGLVPTYRLAILLAAAGVAGFVFGLLPTREGAGPAALCLLLAAAASLVDALGAPRARHLRFQRSLRGVLRLGGDSWVDVAFGWSGPAAGPARRLWWTDLAPAAVVARAPEGRGVLAPGAQVAASYPLRPTRRGQVRWSGPVFTLTSPLGLWALRVVADVGLAATVYPADARTAPAAGRGVQAAVPAPGERGIEFAGVRPYLPGEDARLIHWRATARRDQPVVRHLQPERDRRLMLVLDCGRWSGQRLGEAAEAPTRLDAFCAAAIAVARAALAAGDAVGCALLASGAPPAVLAPRRDAQTLARIAERLAGVSASAGDPDLSAAVASLLRLPADAILWFGEAPSSLDADPLLHYLPRLARWRRTVFLETLPPLAALTGEDARAGRRDERRQLLARAMAEESRRRSALIASLARQGVPALDAPPERLAAEALAAYRRWAQGGRST